MDKIKRKVAVVGEAAVGKTALVQTYCSGGKQISKDYTMTLVADIASKILEKEDEPDLELYFYDMSGREMLRQPVTALLGESHCCIFVFDSTNATSFTALDGWVDLVKKANQNNIPPSVVVSTKNDFSAMRAVNPEQAQAFAKRIDAEYFALDALNYQQVEEALNTLAVRAK